MNKADDSATARPAAVRPSREGDPAAERARPPKVRDGLFFTEATRERIAHRCAEGMRKIVIKERRAEGVDR